MPEGEGNEQERTELGRQDNDQAEGKTAYVRRRLLEAHSDEELEQIEDLLVDEEGVRSSTLRSVKSKLKKGGELNFESHETLPGFPTSIKSTEVISPESIIQRLANGDRDQRLRYEGWMQMQVALQDLMRLTQISKLQAETEAIRLKPMLQLLSFSREEIDAAAARARDSSFAIARSAANQVLGRYTAEIDQHLPKTPAAPPAKSMDELVPRAMSKLVDFGLDMAINNITRKLSPGGAAGAARNDGWVEKEEIIPPPAAAGKDDEWIAETRQAEVG